ncbi:hypothetical protein GUJ93_ZPchr0006g45737 [Zizania palustris]|uniref:Uncharacterized protein n=1 Tax=Zizania palustris TaxID=103762 RepID=A0A8J5T8Z6_ZIZPA|nr:hypothetical protein GUJ93_ZPchr0006g45737 [Zizania palustris]
MDQPSIHSTSVYDDDHWYHRWIANGGGPTETAATQGLAGRPAPSGRPLRRRIRLPDSLVFRTPESYELIMAIRALVHDANYYA